MQTALVTGGSSGIGRAAALRLAEHGFGVVLTYRGHRADADDTVAQIEASGSSAVAAYLDITDLGSFTKFFTELTGILADRWHTDHLDVLVKNAGIGGAAAFGEVTEEVFDQFHLALFKGPYFLTQALLPLFTEGTAIVNTGSTSALPTGTTSGYSAYAAQKGAMHTLTRCWAKELAPQGIRVNAVAPGSTRTRIADNAFAGLSDDALGQLSSTVALGRVGESDDIARTIVFLANQESGWVTGEVIECSGGQGW